VKDDLVAKRKGRVRDADVLVATGVKGLNTTSKVSVLDVAVLGSAAGDAAAIATTPAKPPVGLQLRWSERLFAWLPLPAAEPALFVGPAVLSGQPPTTLGRLQRLSMTCGGPIFRKAHQEAGPIQYQLDTPAYQPGPGSTRRP
jgi:hypothetical protein